MDIISIIRSFAMHSNLRKLKVVCLLLISFSLKVSAPCWTSVTIYEFPPVEPYKNLIFAIGMVETKGDTLAYNPYEEASGIFQIRPIRLKDYNQRTGNNYKSEDLFNYEISKRIFLYYADMVGPYKFEQIARRWNGSGLLTTSYWYRIRQYLKSAAPVS
jgi:hypothetical protein